MGTATILDSFRPSEQFDLTIHSSASGELVVFETSGRLPIGCPERHINFTPNAMPGMRSGDFCLGLASQLRVVEPLSAIGWWLTLDQFLRNQLAFDRWSSWPAKYALDHGAAAEIHLEEIEKAEVLGLSSAVTASFLEQPSILNDPELGIIDCRGKVILSAICPCSICESGTTISDCHPDLMQELVKLDQRRIRARRKFYSNIAVAGAKCCGALEHCPLNMNARMRQ